jgi:hypothetical protein
MLVVHLCVRLMLHLCVRLVLHLSVGLMLRGLMIHVGLDLMLMVLLLMIHVDGADLMPMVLVLLLLIHQMLLVLRIGQSAQSLLSSVPSQGCASPSIAALSKSKDAARLNHRRWCVS